MTEEEQAELAKQMRSRYLDALQELPTFNGIIKFNPADNRVHMTLESFEALCAVFKDSLLYGLKHPDNGNETVFPLPNTDYRTASDIAEKSGTLLMYKIHSEWTEA